MDHIFLFSFCFTRSLIIKQEKAMMIQVKSEAIIDSFDCDERATFGLSHLYTKNSWLMHNPTSIISRLYNANRFI